MINTARFRTQHDELLAIVNDISGLLDVNALNQDASQARSLLSKLLGKLKVHLAMEDKSLYPQLISHDNDKIKSVAGQFKNEMSGIARSVEEYNQRWPTATSIQENASAFVRETSGLFNALGGRIDKENSVLYKLCDDLG